MVEVLGYMNLLGLMLSLKLQWGGTCLYRSSWTAQHCVAYAAASRYFYGTVKTVTLRCYSICYEDEHKRHGITESKHTLVV